MKAQDLYEKVAASLIAKLEAGEAGTWTQSWTGGTGLPTNAQTGRAYRGGNVLWFWMVAEERGYPTNVWATYNQWAALGAQVREGENARNGRGATYGIKWVFPDPGEVKAARERGEKEPRAFPRTFAVFNAAQVDGYDAPVPEPGPAPVDAAEAFLGAQGATIRQGAPAYNPRTDTITLPDLGAFESAEAYYATSAHEHVHRTGAESRLGREGIVEFDGFGSERYAREELVAEFGAAFVCAHLGLSQVPRPDHAAYLANWLRALRDDPKALFTAASAAQKAVDYMIERVTEARTAAA